MKRRKKSINVNLSQLRLKLSKANERNKAGEEKSHQIQKELKDYEDELKTWRESIRKLKKDRDLIFHEHFKSSFINLKKKKKKKNKKKKKLSPEGKIDNGEDEETKKKIEIEEQEEQQEQQRLESDKGIEKIKEFMNNMIILVQKMSNNLGIMRQEFSEQRNQIIEITQSVNDFLENFIEQFDKGESEISHDQIRSMMDRNAMVPFQFEVQTPSRLITSLFQVDMPSNFAEIQKVLKKRRKNS